MGKILVAYFSAEGTTRAVAQEIAAAARADLREIKPAVPYTKADLDWRDKHSRSSVEMADRGSRPALAEPAADVGEYDVVLLGFPIWWYVAPTIVNSYLESGDFSGKRVVIFATSGGSGLGKAAAGLRCSLPDSASIEDGRLFNGKPAQNELNSWLEGLGL